MIDAKNNFNFSDFSFVFASAKCINGSLNVVLQNATSQCKEIQAKVGYSAETVTVAFSVISLCPKQGKFWKQNFSSFF